MLRYRIDLAYRTLIALNRKQAHILERVTILCSRNSFARCSNRRFFFSLKHFSRVEPTSRVLPKRLFPFCFNYIVSVVSNSESVCVVGGVLVLRLRVYWLLVFFFFLTHDSLEYKYLRKYKKSVRFCKSFQNRVYRVALFSAFSTNCNLYTLLYK